MRIRIIFTLSLLLSYYLADIYAQENSSNFPDQDQIQKWIAEKYNDTVPGIAIGVVKDGEVYFQGYAGMANLEHQVPVTDSTRFNIASVAKQFTALCVLQLILEDKLSLDDDLRNFLPNFYSEYPDPIQIRHLLAHSSGIRDLYDLLSLEGRPWWARVGYDMGDAMEVLAAQKSLNDIPGTNYRYSNSGYLLLTQIVEQVSGQTFPEYSANLFDRLGMYNTRFQTNYMTVIPNKALPYNDWGDGIWKQYPMVVELYGDGFLFTTLRDQLHFEQLLQTRAGDFEGLLVESQKEIPGSAINSYGFGLELNSWEGYEVIEHEGATGSYGAHTLRIPELDLSVVVMKSNGSYRARALARDLAKMFMPQATGISARESAAKDNKALENLSTTSLKESLVSRLPALYLLEEGLTFIRISRKAGELYREIEGRDPVRLIPISKKPIRNKDKDGKAIEELAFVYETVPDLKMVFILEEGQVSGFELRQEGSGPRPAKRLEPTGTQALSAMQLGYYYNDELGISFELSKKKTNALVLTFEGKTRSLEQKAKGLWESGDFILRTACDSPEACSRLLLDSGRMRNIEFKYQE